MDNDHYCCIGVLADINNDLTKVNKNNDNYGVYEVTICDKYQEYFLSDELLSKYGMTLDEQYLLSAINDRYNTFESVVEAIDDIYKNITLMMCLIKII